MKDYYLIYTIDWDDPNYPLSPLGGTYPPRAAFLKVFHRDHNLNKEEIGDILSKFYFGEIYPMSFRFRKSSLEEKESNEFFKTFQLLRERDE